MATRRERQPPPKNAAAVLALDDIVIGQRHRKQHNNIESLARSIEAVGLLHPVVIDRNNRLIAGERRIKAFQFLGRAEIPVTVVDLAEIVHGEHAENTEREDFTLSEAVSIKRAIEPMVKAEAEARMKAGKKARPGANLAQGKGKVRDIVAAHTGKARTSLAKAEVIIEAAEAEPDNAYIARLVERMDSTGRVNGPYKRLKVMRQAEIIRAEPPPLPGRGPYRVIVIDPPWPYEIASEDSSIRGVWPYPTMSVSEIRNIDIASIAHQDCILWLWTTNYHMQVVFDLLSGGWGGFQHRTILTWAKDRMGAGDWLRGQTEHCVMAIRGRPTVTLTDQTTLLHAPVRGHSVKPVEFYDLVESLCPASRYADIFSRYRHNEKWDRHGDQAPAAVDDLDIPLCLRRRAAP